MRRTICYCEPAKALAGQINTWKFVFSSSTSLPKGTKLKFDLASDGREIDWEIPSTKLNKGKNVIYAKVGKKTLQAKEVNSPYRFAPQYEFILPAKLETGQELHIFIGSAKNSEKSLVSSGTQAQHNTQRRRPFYLYIDTNGKGYNDEPEVFSMDIRGSKLHTIKVLTPSIVTRNKRFDITLRFEDEFGNLTNRAAEETLIELSHEHLRENLKWQLFVPETGFILLPNLYFNEPGVYTIQLKNLHTGEIFKSGPIKCLPENNYSIFWGQLHGESERFDATEDIENCLRHIRDEKNYNFFAVSPFEDHEETPNELWRSIVQNTHEFDEPERFSTLVGFQWQGEVKSEGLRHIIYLKDQKTLLRKKDAKYNTLKKIYKNFSPKEILSIPSFTMGKGTEFDFKNINPDFERVVEIYNAWGSSECSKKEGNEKPITGGKSSIKEVVDGSIRKALDQNYRFGFVAGGLDDRGCFANFFESDQEQYSPGITAIIAPELSKSAFAEALLKRSCYATTGEKIILGFFIAGIQMGQEVSTADKPGLMINRHISGYVAGTTKIEKIEIIRNGTIIHTIKSNDYHIDYTYDDMEQLEKITFAAKDKKPPFVYYYIKVTQQDGHIAWSSPIWVDLEPRKPIIKKAVKNNQNSKILKDLKIDDTDDEAEDF